MDSNKELTKLFKSFSVTPNINEDIGEVMSKESERPFFDVGKELIKTMGW